MSSSFLRSSSFLGSSSFLRLSRGGVVKTICLSPGGQTFLVGSGGGHDDVDKEMDGL